MSTLRKILFDLRQLESLTCIFTGPVNTEDQYIQKREEEELKSIYFFIIQYFTELKTLRIRHMFRKFSDVDDDTGSNSDGALVRVPVHLTEEEKKKFFMFARKVEYVEMEPLYVPDQSLQSQSVRTPPEAEGMSRLKRLSIMSVVGRFSTMVDIRYNLMDFAKLETLTVSVESEGFSLGTYSDLLSVIMKQVRNTYLIKVFFN